MRKALALLFAALLLSSAAFAGPNVLLEKYRAREKAVAKGDVNGHYELGLWCRHAGLAEQAKAEFEKVLQLCPDHAGARQALGYVRSGGRWVSHEKAMQDKGLVLHDGKWLLPEQVRLLTMPRTEREELAREKARVRSLLRTMVKGNDRVRGFAKRALAGIDDAAKVEPLSYALRSSSKAVRLFAAKELGRIGDRRGFRPLVYRSLEDPSDAVRKAALAAAKSFHDPNLLAPYVRALSSDEAGVRINAEKDIGDLGDIRGVVYLVYVLEGHGGSLTHANIYVANQISFIQDFDVQVAQSAFIADPDVGVLQDGVVMDVRVLSTEEHEVIVEKAVIRRSLEKLTGVDEGTNGHAWAKWWARHRRTASDK